MSKRVNLLGWEAWEVPFLFPESLAPPPCVLPCPGGFQFAHLVVPALQYFTGLWLFSSICSAVADARNSLGPRSLHCWPAHPRAEPFCRPLACLCGTLWLGVHPAGEENPLMLVLQTLEGEKRGNSFSLETCGLSPKAPGTPLPQRIKATTSFSPLGQWFQTFLLSWPLFVVWMSFCFLHFYLPNCTNETTIHFSLFKLTKDVSDWVYNKINVPMIPMMLSTANQSFWSAWDNQCDHSELIKFQQAKITDV